VSFCAHYRPFLFGFFAYTFFLACQSLVFPLSFGSKSRGISLKDSRMTPIHQRYRYGVARVFAAAFLVAAGACGQTDQKVDPPKSVAAHSVDTVAPAGSQSVTHTAGGETVVISGQAKDCFVPGQERGVPALDVRAIDPASNGSLVGVLRSLDTLNMIGPPPAPANWNSAYAQLKSLWASATALTHDSTSSTGSFSLAVPSMDSVLVLTFDEVEDANSYYQYQVVGAR
jgi:hypothetical protein